MTSKKAASPDNLPNTLGEELTQYRTDLTTVKTQIDSRVACGQLPPADLVQELSGTIAAVDAAVKNQETLATREVIAISDRTTSAVTRGMSFLSTHPVAPETK